MSRALLAVPVRAGLMNEEVSRELDVEMEDGATCLSQ